MSSQQGRYAGARPPAVAEGWHLQRLTPVSRLFGANGVRTGPDGRLYVAQVAGSQISAIDVTSGEIEAISPMGGQIVGPDDLAFGTEGELYVTEFTEGRVSVRAPNGATRVLNDDIPGANPVTVHRGRLFVGECRPGARLMELDRSSGAARVILDDVPMLNAMEVGPDGLLYFPVMGTNEIWRIDPDGGAPEVVARDLGVPDSVKFDSRGRIVSTQVASGQVLRIDPRNGEREILADIGPGLDNVTFVGERIFVSHITGRIDEVLGGGRIRPLVAGAFLWPLGLAMGDDGALFVADGPFSYTLRSGEERRLAGMLFSPGTPGFVRGVAAAGPGAFLVTTADGNVAVWWPAQQRSEVLAEGFDQLMGVARGPDGAVAFAEWGGGRVLSLRSGKVEVLAAGLDRPSGVALGADGDVFVAESGAGRVLRVSGGGIETVLDRLGQPQGLAIHGDRLYALDAGHKALLELDLSRKTRRSIATGLPVGPPPGVVPKPLKPVPPLAGAMGSFAGLAIGADGVVYVSADTEGSVLALRPPAGGH